MKIIEPSAELIDDINAAEIYNKIERCGRVSHQSESKGKPEEFIRKIISLGHESVLEHASLTFHIICDRAIQNELVRHRHASFTVESTRYVKYDEMTFIQDLHDGRYFTNGDIRAAYEIHHLVLEHAKENYKILIQNGFKPEDARAVLPLCTKSELYMTANLRAWRYILKLRTSKAAHPQMRQIMNQILGVFRDKLPVIVEDIEGGD